MATKPNVIEGLVRRLFVTDPSYRPLVVSDLIAALKGCAYVGPIFGVSVRDGEPRVWYRPGFGEWLASPLVPG